VEGISKLLFPSTFLLILRIAISFHFDCYFLLLFFEITVPFHFSVITEIALEFHFSPMTEAKTAYVLVYLNL